jgi:hypothetical protein
MTTMSNEIFNLAVAGAITIAAMVAIGASASARAEVKAQAREAASARADADALWAVIRRDITAAALVEAESRLRQERADAKSRGTTYGLEFAVSDFERASTDACKASVYAAGIPQQDKAWAETAIRSGYRSRR